MGRRPCCSKDLGLNRGAWTAFEDKILTDYIQLHGEGKWRHLPERAGLKRCGKSCRLRWLNYLRPGIKRGSITEEEEDLIIRLHRLLGNRWALIAGRLPGRTDNEIKNYWHTKLSKTTNNIIKPHSSDHSGDHTQDQRSSLDEPNRAKKRRFCESSRPTSPDHDCCTVVRTKATRFTKPVTVVPQQTEETIKDHDQFESFLSEEQQEYFRRSDFAIDFDADQSFLSEFFADWISEPPYSDDVEGNNNNNNNVTLSSSTSTSDDHQQTGLLFPSSDDQETPLLPRVCSDLESMASLIIQTDNDHLETWF